MVLFAALVVTPVVVLTLWLYPGWETMWVVSAPSVWLVAAVVPGLVGAASAGYLLTCELLVRKRYGAACAQWHAAVFVTVFLMFHGWDGTGYQRMLSPDSDAFALWAHSSVVENAAAWLLSPVARLVAVLTVLTVIAFFLMACRCEGLSASGGPGCAGREHGWLAVRPVASAGFAGCALAAVGVSTVVHLVGWFWAVLALSGGAVALGSCGLSAAWYAPLDPRLRSTREGG